MDELTNVTVECLNGREPSVEVATCRSGRWEPDIPECKIITIYDTFCFKVTTISFYV